MSDNHESLLETTYTSLLFQMVLRCELLDYRANYMHVLCRRKPLLNCLIDAIFKQKSKNSRICLDSSRSLLAKQGAVNTLITCSMS